MNKSDIIRHVAGETGLTRSAAETAVDSMLSCIAGALARDEAVNLLPKGVIAFPGSGITENLVDKARQLGIPVQRIAA